MTRREDHQTTDLAGAAAFEAHHAIEPLPADHGITAADVAFTMPDREWCPGCERRDCIDCGIRVALGREWGAA